MKKRPAGFWKKTLEELCPTKLTVPEIAAKYDATEDTVAQALWHYGYKVGTDYKRRPYNKSDGWTKDELALVTRWYAWEGAKKTAARLQRLGYNRTFNAVNKCAQKLMLDGFAPNGYVAIREAHANTIRSSIAKAAKRDGVLKKANRAWVVPEDWFDEWMEQETEQMQHAQARQDWVTITDIARAKGMKPTTLRWQWQRNRKVGAKLRQIKHDVVYYPTMRYVWPPEALKI